MLRLLVAALAFIVGSGYVAMYDDLSRPDPAQVEYSNLATRACADQGGPMVYRREPFMAYCAEEW